MYARSSGPNHGGLPAAAFSRMCTAFEVAGIATWHRGSLSIHLSSAWGHVETPKGRNGASASDLTGRRSRLPYPNGRMMITPIPRSAADGRMTSSTSRS
jgi:hypothetical protein